MNEQKTDYSNSSIAELSRTLVIDLTALDLELLKVLQKKTDVAYESARRAVNKISDAISLKLYEQSLTDLHG